MHIGKQFAFEILIIMVFRINATDDDIRRAYRKMVLQHHPDKRKAKGEEIDTDNDYFTCITKAYEILGELYVYRLIYAYEKNRSYSDSIL